VAVSGYNPRAAEARRAEALSRRKTWMRQMPDRARPRIAGTAPAAALLLVAFSLTCSAPAGFDTAPPLHLPDLDGRMVAVDYADARLTLVNFWATWCLPCVEEMPQIERLAEKYGPLGFMAVGVVLESGEPAQVRDFLAREMLGGSYTILMGDDEIAAAYGNIQIIPTTYLVGPGGEILGTYLGATERFEEEIGAEIEAYLSGGLDARASPSP
jgi:thiol-disulfide isomerase/thioredoxin